MKNILTIVTLGIVTALLIGGLYYQNNPIMWLASTSTEYAYLRGAIVVVLVALLFSNPPRALWVRSTILILATLLGGAAIGSAYLYEMQMMDTIILSEVAIVLALEALEVEPRVVPKKPAAKLGSRASA